jgi:hypothetical protein
MHRYKGTCTHHSTYDKVICAHPKSCAERRALAQWEREEAERLKEERTRRALGQAKAEKEYSRVRLTKELQQLRSRERETGVKLHDDKVCGRIDC